MAKTAIWWLSFAGGRTQCSWAWKSQIRVHGSLDSLRISEVHIQQGSGQLSWEPKEAWQGQEFLAPLWWFEMPLSGFMPLQSWSTLGTQSQGHFGILGNNRNARPWNFPCPNSEINQVLFQQPQSWGSWQYLFPLLWNTGMLEEGKEQGQDHLKLTLKLEICFSQLSHRCAC